MTDTEWTRYAFTLPGDDGPQSFDSPKARSLPCEVTICRNGTLILHLGSGDYMRGGVDISDEQMQALVSKWHALKEGHRG